MAETKRRRNQVMSITNKGFEGDDVEMNNRPESAASRGALLDTMGSRVHIAKVGMDTPVSMKSEPFSYLKQVQSDSRAINNTLAPVDCWSRLKKSVRSLWQTRLTEDSLSKDKDLYIKTTLRELVIYIIFLIDICIVAFGMTSSTSFYFNQVMNGLLSSQDNTFSGIGSMEDFFNYMDNTLIPQVYPQKLYNSQNMSTDEMGYIFNSNKLVGVPRVRQLRVRNDSCVIPSSFKMTIEECFAPYSEAAKDVGPFGLMNDTAWVFTDANTMNGIAYYGTLATYPSGGFYILLGKTLESSLSVSSFLKNNLWLDRGTRAVFIDLTVYNANINLFCVITLAVEFPATGGAFPSASLRPVKLIRYVTNFDYFVMACEGIFIIFLLYYFVEEVLEISRVGWIYLLEFGNILDLLILLLGGTTVGISIYRTLSVSGLLTQLLEKPDLYANFEQLTFWQQQFNNLIAILVFIAWIKIFKYVSFNKTMSQLSSTLSRCAKDIGSFAVMFFIVFLAYAQWGFLTFGTQDPDYKSFTTSVYTLFRIILGDFSFDQLNNANRVLGPIFFISYVFFVFFVLLNMFLAIINDTYSEVKTDLMTQQSEFEIGDYFKKGYDDLLKKLSFRKEKIEDIQKTLQQADANNDNRIDFNEWRQAMKLKGHADAEIEAVFAKYDTDGDHVLDEDEKRKMMEDLEGQQNNISDEMDEMEKKKLRTVRIEPDTISVADSDVEQPQSSTEGVGGVPMDDFLILTRRVDKMESSITSIVGKIDSVLSKLEVMEKTKIKRREAIVKLLDTMTGEESQDGSKQIQQLFRDELEHWDAEDSRNVLDADALSRKSHPRAVTSMSRTTKDTRSGGGSPMLSVQPRNSSVPSKSSDNNSAGRDSQLSVNTLSQGPQRHTPQGLGPNI